MPNPRVSKELFEDLLGEFQARSKLRLDLAKPQTVHKYKGCFLISPPDAYQVWRTIVLIFPQEI